MAAPTLVLPDGTIMKQMAPAQLLAMVAITPALTKAWTPREADLGIPSAVQRGSIVVMDPVEFRVPPPPMGRQIAVTFPPVYKEFGSKTPRPDEGRVWPRPVTD